MNYFNKKDLKVCTTRINSTIKDVITSLNKSSMQIVLINSQEGNMMGVITDGDIRRGLLRGLDLGSKIIYLIKKNPTVVEKNTPQKTVEYLMKTKSLLHLPVVDKNYKVVGLYSWNDHKSNEKITNPIVIMAGGFGTRLRPYTNTCPKPMLEIGGKPMLEHIIERAKKEGFNHFVLAIYHLGQIIENHFGNGDKLGVKIDYIREQLPLGTAGALSLLNPIPDIPFVSPGPVVKIKPAVFPEDM